MTTTIGNKPIPSPPHHHHRIKSASEMLPSTPSSAGTGNPIPIAATDRRVRRHIKILMRPASFDCVNEGEQSQRKHHHHHHNQQRKEGPEGVQIQMDSMENDNKFEVKEQQIKEK
jgi:hypothetical protein